MANQNNNISKLVTKDEVPASEMEVLSIPQLQSELRSRDKIIGRLQTDIQQLRARYLKAQAELRRRDKFPADKDLSTRLQLSEKYADEIRQQSQDLIEKNELAGREIDSLSTQLATVTARNEEITRGITSATSEIAQLQQTLDNIENEHQKEIRILRFELGNAQTTVVKADEMNSQLASDLIDARTFKDELEQMLGDSEEQASERIRELEKRVRKLTIKSDSLEQKLKAKTEAISGLLAELAKKSDRMGSIGNIDDEHPPIAERAQQDIELQGAEKITRMLIGTYDNQLLRLPLFKKILTIGRTADNDIQLLERCVSRHHAVIQTVGDTTRIVDQDSKNGIQVNSVGVSDQILNHGDTIVIGNAKFRFEEHENH